MVQSRCLDRYRAIAVSVDDHVELRIMIENKHCVEGKSMHIANLKGVCYAYPWRD